MYVVKNSNGILYVGTNQTELIRALRDNPGSSFLEVESLVDLINLLEVNDCSGNCGCHSHVQPEIPKEDVEATFSQLGDLVKEKWAKFKEELWVNLEKQGLSKEEIQRARQEFMQSSAEAELTFKDGIAKFGKFLVRAGNALIEKTK